MPVTIQLDRGNGPYKGGDVVTGHVVVVNRTNKTKKLASNLTVRFQGVACTFLQDRKSHNVTYSSEEELYFNLSFPIFGPDQSLVTAFSPGISQLPFYYQLPENIPSSFKTGHGRVRYTIEVLYRKPWNWFKQVKRKINVEGSYGLTQEIINQPGKSLLSKESWCGLGKVEAELSTTKQGFFPGENLHFCLSLENKSSIELKKIRVYFMQITTYYNTNGVVGEKVEKSHVKLKCQNVAPWQSMNFLGCMTIPANLPPTDLGNCKIIQPRYHLTVKVEDDVVNLLFYPGHQSRVPIFLCTSSEQPQPSSPIPSSLPLPMPTQIPNQLESTVAGASQARSIVNNNVVGREVFAPASLGRLVNKGGISGGYVNAPAPTPAAQERSISNSGYGDIFAPTSSRLTPNSNDRIGGGYFKPPAALTPTLRQGRLISDTGGCSGGDFLASAPILSNTEVHPSHFTPAPPTNPSNRNDHGLYNDLPPSYDEIMFWQHINGGN